MKATRPSTTLASISKMTHDEAIQGTRLGVTTNPTVSVTTLAANGPVASAPSSCAARRCPWCARRCRRRPRRREHPPRAPLPFGA